MSTFMWTLVKGSETQLSLIVFSFCPLITLIAPFKVCHKPNIEQRFLSSKV